MAAGERDELIAALQATQGQISRLLGELAYADARPHDAAIPQREPGGSWRVIDNGQRRCVPEAEAVELCATSQADLVLHVPRSEVRRRGCPGGRTSSRQWCRISWAKLKVLRVGMSQPGVAFGHKTISYSFGGITISPRSLSRYIADLTKLIQGGGTNGPYVRRVWAGHDESETGWGYVFDEEHNYLVVEGRVGQKKAR